MRVKAGARRYGRHVKNASLSIKDLTSSVVDNGRRGEPKLGCDCVQCFGYCLVDADKAAREGSERGLGGIRARMVATNAPIDLLMREAA